MKNRIKTGKSAMLRKLLLAWAIFISSMSAEAGFYLGGSLGIQNTKAYNGLFASAFGGYGLIFGPCQNFYFAGEIFGDTGSLPLSQNYYRRTNYGFGASILPGYI